MRRFRDLPIKSKLTALLATTAALPVVLKNMPGMKPDGFTGAVGALKVTRQ